MKLSEMSIYDDYKPHEIINEIKEKIEDVESGIVKLSIFISRQK